MAIYQFVIELLPSKWVAANKLQAISLLYCDADEYDTSVAWKSFSLPAEFDFLVSEILPVGKSWHSNLKLWGKSEGHDIQIWIEGDKVDSITLRLDLREDASELKIKLLNLIKSIDCSIFIPEQRTIINAEINELNKVIARSKAADFVNNPKEFLSKIDEM